MKSLFTDMTQNKSNWCCRKLTFMSVCVFALQRAKIASVAKRTDSSVSKLENNGNKDRMKLSDFNFLMVLGKGSFGKVTTPISWTMSRLSVYLSVPSSVSPSLCPSLSGCFFFSIYLSPVSVLSLSLSLLSLSLSDYLCLPLWISLLSLCFCPLPISLFPLFSSLSFSLPTSSASALSLSLSLALSLSLHLRHMSLSSLSPLSLISRFYSLILFLFVCLLSVFIFRRAAVHPYPSRIHCFGSLPFCSHALMPQKWM